MAVHCPTVNDYLTRTTSLLALTTATATRMVWTKNNASVTGAANCAYAGLDVWGAPTSEGGLFTEATNLSDLYVQRPAGFFTDLTGNTLSASVWHHLAWTVSGNTHRLYLDGVLQGAPFSFDLSGAPTPASTALEVLGSDGFGSTDHDVAYYRSWSGTALTQAQIQAEMVSTTPVITANLWQSNDLDGSYADQSGNGRSWTAVGSVSFTTGPTLVPNAGSVNAIPITSLPYSTTLKISPTGTVNPDVWFSYTAVAGDVVIGTWAFTSLASAHKPSVTVWVNIAGTLTRLSDSVDINNATNIPYSVPVTPGLTYYFDVVNAGLDDASTASLTFSAVAQPALGVSRGDLFVNDETYGFPLMALDPTTGVVKRPIVYSAGESADIQPDGSSLAEALDFNLNPIGLQRWDNNFTLLQTIAYPANFHGEVFHIVSSALGGWFVSAKGADNTHTTVTKFSAAGVAGTTRTITHAASTSIVGVCPSPDDSILYYAVVTTGAAVQRWDWVNDVALADLTAGIANYQPQQDIVVLSDGTVVVSHYKGSATRDGNVHRYSAAGALLNTYPLGATTLPNRACRASGDPAFFWLWLYTTIGSGQNDGTDRFVMVNVATGAFSPDFTVAQYDRGNYQPAATATPSARFGPSFSCPMFQMTTPGSIISLPIGGGGGGAGGGTTVFPIRRVRRSPTLAHENLREFHRMLVLDVVPGEGASTGQGQDPVVMMRYSDDAGRTWSDELRGSVGQMGHYGWQVFWPRLGMARNRVYEFVISDPVNFTLQNAYVTVEEGTGMR